MSSIHDDPYAEKPLEEIGPLTIIWERDENRVKTVVPPEQAWLWYALDKQTKLLQSIKTSAQILAVLTVLGVVLAIILAACNAILGY